MFGCPVFGKALKKKKENQQRRSSFTLPCLQLYAKERFVLLLVNFTEHVMEFDISAKENIYFFLNYDMLIF